MAWLWSVYEEGSGLKTFEKTIESETKFSKHTGLVNRQI